MNIRVEVPATRTIGVEVFPLTRNILVEVRTAAEGGGGASTFVELADSTTTELPTLNTPLASALADKAPLASPTFTGNVNGITASMVGLGNVNNTSDANKPVSIAQQAALNAKANLLPTIFSTVAPVEGATIELHDVSIDFDEGGEFTTNYIISTGVLTLAYEDSEGRRIYTPDGVRNPAYRELSIGIGSELTTLRIVDLATELGMIYGYAVVLMTSYMAPLSEWSWPNATYATLNIIPIPVAVGQLCIVNNKDIYVAVSVNPPKWLPLEKDTSTLHLIHPNGKHDRIEAADNSSPNPNADHWTYKLPARSGQVLVTDSLATSFLSTDKGGTGATNLNGFLLKSGDLSGLSSPSAARTNLQLGTGNTVMFAGVTGTPISGSSGSFTTLAASGAITLGGDAVLQRDSPNILALRNGTSPQSFRLYGTYSGGGTNYERGFFGVHGATGAVLFGSEKGGSGIARDVQIFTDGTARWTFGATTGHLLASGAANITTTGAGSFGTLAATGLATLSGGIRLLDQVGISTSDGRIIYPTAAGWGVRAGIEIQGVGAAGNGALSWIEGLNIKAVGSSALQIGLNHASVTTHQTIKAHDITGTTGIGASLTLAGGKGGTTSGAGGAVIISTSATNGAPVARLTVGADGSTSLSGTLTATGAIESTTAAAGLILKSPNGTRYRVTVSDAGTLTTALA